MESCEEYFWRHYAIPNEYLKCLQIKHFHTHSDRAFQPLTYSECSSALFDIFCICKVSLHYKQDWQNWKAKIVLTKYCTRTYLFLWILFRTVTNNTFMFYSMHKKFLKFGTKLEYYFQNYCYLNFLISWNQSMILIYNCYILVEYVHIKVNYGSSCFNPKYFRLWNWLNVSGCCHLPASCGSMRYTHNKGDW